MFLVELARPVKAQHCSLDIGGPQVHPNICVNVAQVAKGSTLRKLVSPVPCMFQRLGMVFRCIVKRSALVIAPVCADYLCHPEVDVAKVA